MIYTKKGDDGTTSLVGGTRVKKFDIRVQTYGEIDHLVSLLGFASALLKHDNYASELFVIQCRLFEIESMVACENEEVLSQVPNIREIDVQYLERKIDTMSKELPALKYFIIPSGSQTATLLNIATTQTRRCERLLVECNEYYPQSPIALKYLNRLSDYLFTLSRMIMKERHRTEKYWKKPEEMEY
ncbi:MAG: cob(I)yrinic acid a,c-diamide adenosyltransferase [Bacteroidales bacterium]|nr:cob(I)yrinic acid a,c-diamide adenosyltransferase [Bacteroidales bacterium]